MDNKLLFEIVIAVIGILGGSGGVFAFITAHQKNKTEDRASSASEWQKLYNEMKERLDEQETANKELKEEIRQLKTQIKALTIELESYKKYDNYVNSLEIYTNSLLNAIKPLVTDDVYRNLIDKRPQRQMDTSKDKSK